MADRAGWIQGRRKRYLATVLTEFERHVEPHLPDSAAARRGVERFKGTTRAKMNALAVDAIDVFRLGEEGYAMNAHAQEIKDQLSPDGRP